MKKFGAILLVASSMLWSCYSDPNLDNLVQHMAVSTNFIEAIDYGYFNTFVIRHDTLGFVSSRYSDEYLTNNSFPTSVVNTIINNLTSRGYTEVQETENPDVGIYAYVLDDYNIFQQTVYPSYYPGSYYGYGYYNYYYPQVQTYVSDYGTLVIELVDLKNSPNQSLVIWNAYIGDLYQTPDLTGKTLEAVNQAFTQSPYLVND